MLATNVTIPNTYETSSAHTYYNQKGSLVQSFKAQNTSSNWAFQEELSTQPNTRQSTHTPKHKHNQIHKLGKDEEKMKSHVMMAGNKLESAQ